MQSQIPSADDMRALLAESLAVAAQAGKVELVRKILATGVDPNKAFDEKGRSALLLACGREEPSLQVIQMLLNAGADPNEAPAQVCALNLVLNRETARLDVVKALLAAGAKANGRNGWLLAMAVERSSTDIVRALVEAGANVNAGRPVGKRHETPIEAAVARASVDKARLLLDAGATIPESLRDEAYWEKCPKNPTRRILAAELLRLSMNEAMGNDAAAPARHSSSSLSPL